MSGSRLDFMESHVDTLIQWTQTTLEALRRDKGGRPAHGARLLFVAGLVELYHKYTGEGPTRRPFRDFVIAALEPLDRWEVMGVDDAIRTALKILK